QQRPLLPIKTDRGQLIAQSAPVVVQQEMQDDDDDNDQEDADDKMDSMLSVTPSEPSKPVSIIELIAERDRKLNETKQTIVNLCDL
ncbi:unnamed protein product, partial [Rotaria magnacalcarata]